ncbi:MAG: cupin, partial [Pseudomonadota bacterium]
LVLGENGVLYDTKKGDTLPHNVSPMPLMSEEELAKRAEPTTADVLPNHVARYWDLMALADRQPAKVIGPDAMLRDRPGFEVDFITRGSIPAESYTCDQPEVLMPMRGHWLLEWDGGSSVLNPGDTCLVPEGWARSVAPSMTGEASMYRVRRTDDPAGKTRAHG